jgi:hypothetical protein
MCRLKHIMLIKYRYDVALLYLEQAGYDLESAMTAFRADEKWEKDHPLAMKKGKAPAPSSGRRRWGFGGSGGGITGQLQ